MKASAIDQSSRVSSFFLSVLFLCSILLSSQLLADEVVLNGGNGGLTDDTCFHPGFPCDSGPLIHGSYWDHAYFRFDLSSITTEIQAAKFRVFSASSSNPADATIAGSDKDDWREEVTPGTTRASFPGAQPTGRNQVLPGFIASTPVNSIGYIEFDVTDFVKAEASGDGIASFILGSVSSVNGWHGYSSKEGSNSPELVITTADSGAPVAAFSATPVTGNAPLTVNFTDASTDEGTLSREWDFGDNSATDSTLNPSHEYIDAGVYTVTLKVTDDDGNENSASQEIAVNPAGSQSGLTGQYFNYQTSTPTVSPPEFVDLVATQVDPEINFDFGEGQPEGIDVGPDTFSVCWKGQVRPRYTETYTFKTFSDDGVELKINNVAVIQELEIRPELAHPRVHAGQITLTAGQLYDIQLAYFDGPQEASISLQWESDSQSLEVIPSSRLITDGTVGSCGDGAPANEKPVASFTSTPDPIIANQAFTLDGSASTDDGTVERYVWLIQQADGSVVQSVDSAQTSAGFLLSAGTYTITLTVFDNQGLASDPLIRQVTISDLPPDPSVTLAGTSPTSGTAPLTVNFSAAAANFPAGATLTYNWDYGDGNTADDAGASPSHEYAEGTGDVTARVTVTDGTTTVEQTIDISVVDPVNQAPDAQLSVVGGAVSGVTPFLVTLDASDSTDDGGNDNLKYSWSFGDSNDTSDDVTTENATKTKSHSYEVPGVYTATVTVEDEAGESTTSSAITITVTEPPNNPPTVTLSTVSQTVNEAVAVNLTVEGADSDGSIAKYIWTINGTEEESTPIAAVAPYSSSLSKSFVVADSPVTVTVRAVDDDGDESAESDPITLTIQLGPIAPVAVDDATFMVVADGSVTINVLDNDSDGNGDTLSVTNTSDPANGTVVVNADNTVTYTPDAGFTGDDSFTYTASDGALESDPVTVTITVAPALQQIVTMDCPDNVRAGAEFTCSVSYDTNNGADTTGLGLKIEYDRSSLEWISFSNTLQNQLVTQDNAPVGPSLLGTLNTAWADTRAEFAWPGEATPVKLYDITFKLTEFFSTGNTTSIRFSTQPANGFVVIAEPEEITAGGFSLDIDGNGEADAFTDGFLVIRYLFGFRGDELINGAIGDGAVLTTAAEIEAFIGDNIASLDVDADGDQEPLTDGLLILRRMLGFEGDTLVGGITLPAGQTATTVADTIDGLLN